MEKEKTEKLFEPLWRDLSKNERQRPREGGNREGATNSILRNAFRADAKKNYISN